VVDLQAVDKDASKILLEGEKSKKKHYRCLIRIDPPLRSPSELELINQLEPFVIFQKTPIRVMHRRSLLTRERTIYSTKCTAISETLFYLDLITQAGTYVKEFVHSDLGRTKPSLAMLFDFKDYECDILLLDVMKVDLDFPQETNQTVSFQVPSMLEEQQHIQLKKE